MVRGQPPFVEALRETKSLVKTRFHLEQRKFREVSLCFINKKLKRACWRERETKDFGQRKWKSKIIGDDQREDKMIRVESEGLKFVLRLRK